MQIGLSLRLTPYLVYLAVACFYHLCKAQSLPGVNSTRDVTQPQLLAQQSAALRSDRVREIKGRACLLRVAPRPEALTLLCMNARSIYVMDIPCHTLKHNFKA